MKASSSDDSSGTDWKRLKAMSDDEILYDDDAPKTTVAFWDQPVATTGGGPEAVLEALKKRRQGQRGPQRSATKVPVNIRLDTRVVEHFKASGKGWQTRLNQALVDLVVKPQSR